MATKPEKITTVEELAVSTQAEFLAVGGRFDRLEHKVDSGFDRMDRTFKVLVDLLDLMRADIHDIKVTLGGLIRTVTALEEQVQVLDKRVTRLEQKAGFAEEMPARGRR